MALQTPWINGLAEGLPTADIEAVREVISTVRQRLEAAEDIED